MTENTEMIVTGEICKRVSEIVERRGRQERPSDRALRGLQTQRDELSEELRVEREYLSSVSECRKILDDAESASRENVHLLTKTLEALNAAMVAIDVGRKQPPPQARRRRPTTKKTGGAK